MSPQFFGKYSHLWFERRFSSQQNSVIRLTSYILLPPNFWACYASDAYEKTCHHEETPSAQKTFA